MAKDEELFLAEVMRWCPGRRLAIDGGANVGAWSVEMMNLGFERVIAFEPDARNFERLCAMAKVWPEIEPRQQALLNAPATVPFMGRNSTSMHIEFDAEGDKVQMVDAITIDSLGLRELDLLKLDLEGADALALMGARRTLKRCRPLVVVESVPKLCARYGLTGRAALQYLRKLGAREIANDRPNPNHAFAWPAR